VVQVLHSAGAAAEAMRIAAARGLQASIVKQLSYQVNVLAKPDSELELNSGNTDCNL
jgi:hypothetical protein